MKLVIPFALALAAAACRPALGPILDVTEQRALRLPRATGADPRVRVRGPATIYVIQDSRVRALVEWPRTTEGVVTVPLTAIDDRSGPIFVGIRPGAATIGDGGNASYCMVCDPRNEIRCCPKGGTGPDPDPKPPTPPSPPDPAKD